MPTVTDLSCGTVRITLSPSTRTTEGEKTSLLPSGSASIDTCPVSMVSGSMNPESAVGPEKPTVTSSLASIGASAVAVNLIATSAPGSVELMEAWATVSSWSDSPQASPSLSWCTSGMGVGVVPLPGNSSQSCAPTPGENEKTTPTRTATMAASSRRVPIGFPRSGFMLFRWTEKWRALTLLYENTQRSSRTYTTA